MPVPPLRPKIFHITHVANLPAIIAAGQLVSDALMVTAGGPASPIGMETIKARRLTLPVHCHIGDHVGDYVPFYFCSRSVMLYLLYRGNHPDITYKGGQGPIVHLEADLHRTIEWARSHQRKWAFSLSNAGAYYTQFRDSSKDLDEVNWPAVESRDWSSADVKEGKQAEFLIHGTFPWELVERVGVYSTATGNQAMIAIAPARHRPLVEVKAEWYY